MDLSSLNVDVLLYLIKFVKPVDRFNLVLSGALKGFENVHNGIDLRQRVECCEAELGLRRDSTCELEIRSLLIKHLPDESLSCILKRLADGGYLQNTRRFDMNPSKINIDFPIVELICSMKNLETLHLLNYQLSPEALAHMFQSCSKITDLRVIAIEDGMLKMDEHLKNQLRPHFQRLRYLYFECYIAEDSWLELQEMLTWLKECVQLSIMNQGDDIFNVPLDGSLTLDPNLAKSLQIAEFDYVPSALVKWILSVSLNIHTLSLNNRAEKLNIFLNEIGCLKKLKELKVFVDSSSELIEIVRSCRQMEILRMRVTFLTREDLVKLEPAENKTDITLRWQVGPSIEEVLSVLKRWRQLRRLTLNNCYSPNNIFPPFEILSDFIKGMTNLSYLHIVPCIYGRPNYDQLKILRDQVNELILPRRPNFKFDISRSDD